ncbi:MAG: ShlB/FhaC/HecB family hemolysin secretion/activation protein [Leptolyngbyaceae cyanobacterium CSU_1_3]|nr:ShlB/FhaC/HecB family hemolysin secretion/activation protein [Leptolyngbyaceae cyanobacterium CSU_1_3]
MLLNARSLPSASLGLSMLICNVMGQPVVAQVVPSVPAELPPPTAQPLPREPQPPSSQPLPREPQTSPRLPPPAELLSPPSSPPDTVTPGDSPQTITVQQFKVTGSTVFGAAEFAKVTQPFTQRPLSLAELFQVRDAVTKFYVDRGYITSGAFIPPQKLEGGVVEIRVIEGGLEDIKISGTRRLSPNYIRSRLAIATRKPLNRAQLLEALQLLQLNPLIQNLSAELSAGTTPGQSLLEVKVAEAPTFDAQVTVDNARSPSVGTVRRQIRLSEANLLGLGDALSVAYTNTNGSNSGDFSYTLPINPRNGTLGFNFGISSSNVIEPPFDILEIESKSRYYELTYRQPIIQKPTQELAIGLTATRRESEATLLDGEVPFPALGADDGGKTKLTALRFFQEWTQRSSRSVFAVRSQFSLGLNALNSTINDSAPDSRFFAWRGQAQWVRLLAPEALLLVRSDLQLADRSLLPFEQFGLGGQDSVRGYRQDALLTDSGLFASAEVRVPILRAPKSKVLLQVTPFVDFGTAWNRSGRANPEDSTLASVGLGLRLQAGDRFTARVDWGIPLVSLEGEKRTLQENGLYFSVGYKLF